MTCLPFDDLTQWSSTILPTSVATPYVRLDSSTSIRGMFNSLTVSCRLGYLTSDDERRPFLHLHAPSSVFRLETSVLGSKTIFSIIIITDCGWRKLCSCNVQDWARWDWHLQILFQQWFSKRRGVSFILRQCQMVTSDWWTEISYVGVMTSTTF